MSSPLDSVYYEPTYPPSQARYFCDFFFQPFIWNLAKGETGGNRRWDGKKLEMAGGGDGYCNKKNRSWYSEAGKSNFNIGKGFPAAGPTLVLKAGWVYERIRKLTWMPRNRKLRRWIDSSVIMQSIFDFDFSMLNIWTLYSPLWSTNHSPQAFKASDILCLLTNSGLSRLVVNTTPWLGQIFDIMNTTNGILVYFAMECR